MRVDKCEIAAAAVPTVARSDALNQGERREHLHVADLKGTRV